MLSPFVDDPSGAGRHLLAFGSLLAHFFADVRMIRAAVVAYVTAKKDED